MAELPARPDAAVDRSVSETDLIALVRGLVIELRGERGGHVDVSSASRLERDLGVDSLGRTELMLRIEREFSVQLPVSVMGEVETVDDLLKVLNQNKPARPSLASPAVTPVLPKVQAATQARTLIEVLDWHVAQHPGRLHCTVLQDDSAVIATLSYAGLARAAKAVAAGLVARDVEPGDRVALMLPTGIDFFAAFFGVLYAGAVPVPIYPPMQLTQIEEYARRQAGILRNAEARILITVPEGLRLGSLLRSLVTTIDSVESVASLSQSPNPARLPNIQAAATALIQYTSGSTGDPKGVVLSHANLLANIRAIGQAIAANSADVMVSWLPLYHDMGLIGAWLGSLYFGVPFYVMSPIAFLARPQSWLWVVHRYRGTITAAPNFAFEMCLSKIDDVALAGLDLSSLRLVANGAEPVSIPTLRRFIERFRFYGFRPEAMAPVYGLAENAVAVALPRPGQLPVIERISRKALSRSGVAESAVDPADVMEVVGCGQPVPDHELRVVDDAGRALGERREGRLEFRGPSATSGYFRNEAKTRELFHDDWLDTGDRGYLAGGMVFITGRVKDIVIRARQHIYPHEVEGAVGDIAGIRRGAVVMFGVADPVAGTERIVVLAETDIVEAGARETLRARAREVTVDAVGIAPDEIVLVRPGTVPKTPSGKIRRAAAKEMYLNGRFESGRRAMQWQILRLSLAGLAARCFRLGSAARKFSFAIWWWFVIAASVVAGTTAVLVLPNLAWRWAAVRGLARAALVSVGAAPSVIGGARIPRCGAILMCNHSSYVDALILAAVLPGEPAYLVKKEFADQAFTGMMLRRLGVLFIDRFDLAESLADITAAIDAAGRDRVLVIFPEGTFTHRSGLLGFFLGGFKIASEAGLPIIPGALRGTRSMLRSDQWLPRKAAISVEFGESVLPVGKDFASVLRLRDLVRAAILARCGEADLNELIKPPMPNANSEPAR